MRYQNNKGGCCAASLSAKSTLLYTQSKKKPHHSLSFLCHNFGTVRHSDFPPCYTSIIHPPQKITMHNLAELSKEDKDKVNVDLKYV